MARLTKSDLDGMFARAVRAADALGFDTRGWRFEHGNRADGAAYTMQTGTGPHTSLGTGFSGDYIGTTAREAYTALNLIARAWEMVAETHHAKTHAEKRYTLRPEYLSNARGTFRVWYIVIEGHDIGMISSDNSHVFGNTLDLRTSVGHTVLDSGDGRERMIHDVVKLAILDDALSIEARRAAFRWHNWKTSQ